MSASQICSSALIAAFLVTQAGDRQPRPCTCTGALTHRALTVHPVAAFPFRFVIWITTGMRPREWVAVHRKHHAVDRHRRRSAQPDASSGSGGCSSATSASTRGPRATREPCASTPATSRTDRLDRVRVRLRAASGSASASRSSSSTMWALGFGLLTGFVAAGLHAVLYVMLAGAINAVGHQFGEQPYANSATNLQSLALSPAAKGCTTTTTPHRRRRASRCIKRRDRSRLVARCARSWRCTSRTCATTTCTSSPRRELRSLRTTTPRSTAVKTTHVVARSRTGYVKLMPERSTSARLDLLPVEVVCARAAHPLHRIDARTFLHRDGRRSSAAVARGFAPRKFNYELLGNSCPHLHWFLIPRYDTDPHPRGPAWEDPNFLRLLWTDQGRLPPAEHDEIRRASPRSATAADVEIEVSFVRGAALAPVKFSAQGEDSCPTPAAHADVRLLRVAGTTSANVNACAVGPCSTRSADAPSSRPAFGRWPSGTHHSTRCTSWFSNHSRRWPNVSDVRPEYVNARSAAIERQTDMVASMSAPNGLGSSRDAKYCSRHTKPSADSACASTASTARR